MDSLLKTHLHTPIISSPETSSKVCTKDQTIVKSHSSGGEKSLILHSSKWRHVKASQFYQGAYEDTTHPSKENLLTSTHIIRLLNVTQVRLYIALRICLVWVYFWDLTHDVTWWWPTWCTILSLIILHVHVCIFILFTCYFSPLLLFSITCLWDPRFFFINRILKKI